MGENGSKTFWIFVVIFILAFLISGCSGVSSDTGIDPQLSEPIILYTPEACCMALTPECLACVEGITVEEWLEMNE